MPVRLSAIHGAASAAGQAGMETLTLAIARSAPFWFATAGGS